MGTELNLAKEGIAGVGMVTDADNGVGFGTVDPLSDARTSSAFFDAGFGTVGTAIDFSGFNVSEAI